MRLRERAYRSHFVVGPDGRLALSAIGVKPAEVRVERCRLTQSSPAALESIRT